MNKYKEALNYIKEIVIDERADGYYQPKTVEHFYYGAISDLNELVEKATPKKPITDGSSYLPSCNKVQYICPHCKQIMLRTICIKAHKPNYCYKCGGALDWGEDDENS